MTDLRTPSSQYIKAVFWSLSACAISALNDAAFKRLGCALPGIVVLFCRFAFSTLVLLPVVFAQPHTFRTRHIGIHGLRGGMFALGMLPWTYSLIRLPLPMMTMLSFTTPLFIIVLAKVVLKETVGWRRAVATGLGFLGVCLGAGFQHGGLSVAVGIALLATLLFASLDIINKRLLVLNEGMGPMMFYSALWTTLLTAPLAFWDWQMPSVQEWPWILLLGLGANGMLWCLLQASKAADLSSLLPLRYTEFVFSSVLSILFFQQWPSQQIVAGICLIIPATLYLARHELNLERVKPKSHTAV